MTEEQTTATQLPKPQGYKLLCAVPEVEDKYESGLYKPESTVRVEEHSTVTLFVVSMGDMAYRDEEKFPTGPWCAEGDFVVTRAYAGTRIKIHGREFRLINDDAVEAVVEDPRGISRAG